MQNFCISIAKVCFVSCEIVFVFYNAKRMHSPDPAFDFLQEHGISYDLYEHDAFHSVSQSSDWAASHPGCHIKNLFLRNKKKTQYFLLFMPGGKKIDFQKLKEVTGERLSFASPDDVQNMLGTTPGHVSPFVLMTASDDISVLVDAEIHKAEYVFFHPLVNHLTIRLKENDFKAMLNAFSHSQSVITL